MTLFPGGTSLSRASHPSLINLGWVAGLFCLETHVSNHSYSSERTSLVGLLSSGGTSGHGRH